MKNKAKVVSYYVPTFIVAVVAFLASRFAFEMTLDYQVFVMLTSALCGFLSARATYLIVKKEMKTNLVISEIWLCYSAVALFGCIRTESYALFGAYLWCVGIGLVNAIGFTYLCSEIEEIPLNKVDDFARMKESLKFKFINDDLNEKPDLSRPLIVIDGVPRSAAEAERMGYGALSADAIEYIKMILKKGK